MGTHSPGRSGYLSLLLAHSENHFEDRDTILLSVVVLGSRIGAKPWNLESDRAGSKPKFSPASCGIRSPKLPGSPMSSTMWWA